MFVLFCLLFLAVTIEWSEAFRSFSIKPYLASQRRWQSTSTDDNLESNAFRITKAPIYAIPRSLVSSEAIVRYLQKWATESTISTGTAISFQQKFNGIRFLFTPAPLSYLDFDVTTQQTDLYKQEMNQSLVSEQEMILEMTFAVHEKDSVQAQSLVKLAAQNLYESLVNDIGALIMNVQDESDTTPKMPDKSSNSVSSSAMDRVQAAMSARESTQVQTNDRAETEVQSNNRASQSNNRAAQSNIPSEEDVLGMWTSQPDEDTEEDAKAFAQEVMNARENESGGKLELSRFNTVARDGTASVTTKTSAVAVAAEEEASSTTLKQSPPSPPTATTAVTTPSPSSESSSPSSPSSPDVEELYAWTHVRSLSSQQTSIVSFVQGFADRFAGRGAGIEADNTVDGVLFDFLVAPGCTLVISVVGEEIKEGMTDGNRGYSSLRVVSKLSLPSSSVNVNDPVADGEMDMSLQTMVKKAAGNVLMSLKKDLAGLVVEQEERSQPTKQTNYNGDMDPSKDQRTVGQSSLSSTSTSFPPPSPIPASKSTNPINRLKPLSVSDIEPDESNGALTEAFEAFRKANNRLDSSIPLNDRQPSKQSPLPSSPLSSQKSSSASSPSQPVRQVDPAIANQARDLGIRLEKFAEVGLEEQAVAELERMMANSHKEGFLSFIQREESPTSIDLATGDGRKAGSGKMEGQELASGVMPQSVLFAKGQEISAMSWQDMVTRQAVEQAAAEDLSLPPTKLPINLKAGGLQGGIDIFEGPPPIIQGDSTQKSVQAPTSSVEGLQSAVAGGELGLPPNPLQLESDQGKLDRLMIELERSDVMMHDNIIDSYRDLMLSDNFLFLMKRTNQMSQHSYETRLLFAKVTQRATILTAELGALVKTESVRHLQTIHDICEVAANYQQNEEQFLERMSVLRPRFDTALLGYLRYAIDNEREKVRNEGGDPDRLPSVWMQVLSVVQNGVLAEFEARYDRLLEPLLLILRFYHIDPIVRTDIFQRLIGLIPIPDLPYLRELAVNMMDKILSTPLELLPDSSLHTQMTILSEDVSTYLSEEIVQGKLEAFRTKLQLEQGQMMVTAYRNPMVGEEEEASRNERMLSAEVGASVLDRGQGLEDEQAQGQGLGSEFEDRQGTKREEKSESTKQRDQSGSQLMDKTAIDIALARAARGESPDTIIEESVNNLEEDQDEAIRQAREEERNNNREKQKGYLLGWG